MDLKVNSYFTVYIITHVRLEVIDGPYIQKLQLFIIRLKKRTYMIYFFLAALTN
jgi:hypothetical protein